GERRRLHLLRVLMEAPNVLLLDEPTNDLDINTLNILEDFLDSYIGVVVVVSHDRYFLDRVCNKIFAYEGNGEIVTYNGNYSDYSIKVELKKANKETEVKKEKKRKCSKSKRKRFKTKI
ncbi:MAG: ATP-binding cassette domain-containing protein, partial [Clostridium sp.]|nr:ATP-binding cassette domain-containing protein [Clostridium sp.]